MWGEKPASRRRRRTERCTGGWEKITKSKRSNDGEKRSQSYNVGLHKRPAGLIERGTRNLSRGSLEKKKGRLATSFFKPLRVQDDRGGKGGKRGGGLTPKEPTFQRGVEARRGKGHLVSHRRGLPIFIYSNERMKVGVRPGQKVDNNPAETVTESRSGRDRKRHRPSRGRGRKRIEEKGPIMALFNLENPPEEEPAHIATYHVLRKTSRTATSVISGGTKPSFTKSSERGKRPSAPYLLDVRADKEQPRTNKKKIVAIKNSPRRRLQKWARCQ